MPHNPKHLINPQVRLKSEIFLLTISLIDVIQFRLWDTRAETFGEIGICAIIEVIYCTHLP